MSDLPNCPKCNSEYTYENGTLFVCPECAHEWSRSEAAEAETARVWKDANGNILQDGDTVTVIKDLKVRGASSVFKGGNEGEEYPSRRGRSRHRLQDRWLRRNATQIGICPEGVNHADS
jgi:protein PhnA